MSGRAGSNRTLTLSDVYARIQSAIRKAGSQAAFAGLVGCTPSFVSQVVNAKRQPSRPMLAAVQIKQIAIYMEDSE